MLNKTFPIALQYILAVTSKRGKKFSVLKNLILDRIFYYSSTIIFDKKKYNKVKNEKERERAKWEEKNGKIRGKVKGQRYILFFLLK